MSVLRDRHDMFCLPNPPTSSSLVIQSSTPTSVLPSSSSTSARGTPRADMFGRSHGGANSSSHSAPSPVDRPLAAAVATRSPASSGTASLAAPPTPSNWMARDPSSLERTPVLAHLPGIMPSLPSGTSLYSPSAAPAGTPGVSPLLKPRHLGLTAFSDVALQDAVELERGADAPVAAERSGTSRRFTPRSGSSSSLPTPSATAVTPRSHHADGDSPSAATTVQRLSRRASATRSVDETRAEEDTAAGASLTAAPAGAAAGLGNGGSVVVLSLAVRRGRSCNSVAAVDSVSAGTPLVMEEEPGTPAGLGAGSLGQVTLHVSRSSSGRASSAATTAPCPGTATTAAAAAAAAGSLPAVAIFTAAAPPASCSINGNTDVAPPQPDRAGASNTELSLSGASTTSVHASPVAPPPPPPHAPTTLAEAGRASSGGALRTSFASGPPPPPQQQQQRSPSQSSSGTSLTQQQLAAHLRGSGTATVADVAAASSSAFVPRNHFASGAELQSRPRYSKASSCASFGLVGAADDAVDDSAVSGSRRGASTTAAAAAAAGAVATPSNATSTSSSASAPRPSRGLNKSSFANSTSSPSFPLASSSYGSVPSTSGVSATTTAAAAARRAPTTDTWMTESPDPHFGAVCSPPPPPPPPPHLSDAAHSTTAVSALAGGGVGDSPLPHPLASGVYTVPDVVAAGGTARPFRSRVRGVTQPVGATKLLFSRSRVPNFSTPLSVMPRSRSSEDVSAGAVHGDGGAVNPSTAMAAAAQDGSDAPRATGLPPFPPPPPPPPPPSRIPSPMLRSLGHMSGGFAAFSHDQHPHHLQHAQTGGHHGGLQAARGAVYDVTGRLVMSRPASGTVSPLPESVPPPPEQPPSSPQPPPSSLPPSRLMSESMVGEDDRGVSFGRSTAFSSKPGSFSSATTTVANTPRHSVDESASRVTSPSLMPSTCRSTPVELSQALPPAHVQLLMQQQQQQHGSAARRRNTGMVPLHTSPMRACKSCGAMSDAGASGGGDAGLAGALAMQRQRGGDSSSAGSGGGSGCRRCSSTSHCESCGECRHGAPSLNGPSRTMPATSTPVRELTSASVASSMLSLAATVTSALSDPMLHSFSSSANLTAPQSATASNLPGPALTAPNTGGGGLAALRACDNFVMRSDAETVQGLPRGKVPRMPGCSMRDWAAHLSAKEAEARRRAPATAPRFGGAGGAVAGAGGASSAAAAHGGGGAGARFASLPRMTPQEVAQHNTSDDLWMVIRNVVYDCTTFQRFHPGGEKLLLACAGRDATAVYDRFHAWVSCESFMAPYAVGVLAPPDSR